MSLPPGVLSDAKAIAEVVRRVSPDTLVTHPMPNTNSPADLFQFQVVLDAVCSVASEEIRMDDWGLDVILTASQKGLGTPPGLSILLASQKAMKVCPIFSLFLRHEAKLPL